MSVFFFSLPRGGADTRESLSLHLLTKIILWKEGQDQDSFSTPLGWKQKGPSKWRRTNASAMASSKGSAVTTEDIKGVFHSWITDSAARHSILSPRFYTENQTIDYICTRLSHSNMKRTIIEKLIIVIAWTGLIGGILFSILYSKSVLESGTEMCVPSGIASLVAGVFVSVGCWAILMEIIALSDRIRKLEERQ